MRSIFPLSPEGNHNVDAIIDDCRVTGQKKRGDLDDV